MRAPLFILALTVAAPGLACGLKVESPWIRAAPPNATALAGYAKFINTADKPIRIVNIESAVFSRAEAHETRVEEGMSTMRPLKDLEIPARGAVEFMPGGKHLMLTQPKRSLNRGDEVTIILKDSGGCAIEAKFVVRDAMPNAHTEHDRHSDHDVHRHHSHAGHE